VEKKKDRKKNFYKLKKLKNWKKKIFCVKFAAKRSTPKWATPKKATTKWAAPKRRASRYGCNHSKRNYDDCIS